MRGDLAERGRYREPKDFKGVRFAMNAPGVSNTAALNAPLKSAGLRYFDLETLNLPFPDHVVAPQNEAVLPHAPNGFGQGLRRAFGGRLELPRWGPSA